jgi:hypothetical protein
MKKKIEALIEVRKIIALMFAGLFVYMAVTETLNANDVLNIVLMVIGYYFGKSTALDKPTEGKKD